MVVYCNECGSANPETSDVCSRCAAAIVKVPFFAGELVLPEWLTRAAAESAETVSVPVRGRAVDAIAPDPAPMPGPIPTGDLATAMPNWLKAPVKPVLSAEREESLLIDPTDTRGFISEDDLPAWIRQIAVADAARKAEAERKSAAVDETQPEPAAEVPAPVKRRLLPGEIEAVRANANPWLALIERIPTEASDTAVRIDLPSPEPMPRAVDNAPTPAAATSNVKPAAGGLNLRYWLIGAIALLVLILIVTVAL